MLHAARIVPLIQYDGFRERFITPSGARLCRQPSSRSFNSSRIRIKHHVHGALRNHP